MQVAKTLRQRTLGKEALISAAQPQREGGLAPFTAALQRRSALQTRQLYLKMS